MLKKSFSKTLNNAFFAVALSLAAMVSAPVAQAANPQQPIGTYDYWRVFVEGSGAAQYCFALGEPVSTLPKGAERGKIFMSIAHRPGQGVRNEVAVSIGYAFSSESNPFAKIDGESFSFFTGVRAQNGADDWAWLLNLKDQKRLVAAMKKGSEMIFKGTSARGTLTTDSYSLRGVTAAMKALDAACPAP